MIRIQITDLGKMFKLFVAFAFVSIPWGNREIGEEDITWARIYGYSQFGLRFGHGMGEKEGNPLPLFPDFVSFFFFPSFLLQL